MRVVQILSPTGDDSTAARRETAEKLVAAIRSEVEFEDMLRAALFQFTPVHHQSRQCLAAAHLLGMDAETVRRWAHGLSTPRARDCWPLFFIAILQNLPEQTQHEVIHAITGICAGGAS